VSSFFCFSGALHRISLERGVVKICRHSGAARALCGQKPESILMFLRENRHPCLFSAPLPGARVTSLCLAKEKSPRERPPRCCAFRPSMDEKFVRSGRACRRAVPGAAASGRNPLRPPCGPDRPALTAAQGPRKNSASTTAILASFVAKPDGLLRPTTRTGCAPSGAPRTRLADAGIARRVARRMRASSPQAQGCAFGEPQRLRAHPQPMDGRRACSRGGFLFGYFLLATQEKVARPPGRRTEKDMDVAASEC